MNVLGYEDNEILFNSTLKTITLNQYPLFETGSVTITDTVHYPEHCPNTAEKCLTSYSTSDKKSIDYLVSVLNEEPFYESNVSIRSVYPNYKLNFNNGTIINVMSPTVCTITVNGKKTGTYQLTFKSSVAIETFIKENINLDSIVYDKWEYDLSDADDLYKKEYISCDYLGGDFSNVIKYLEANIEDFNSKYTYSIVSDKSGTKITVMSDEKTFSIRVYENPGAIRYTIDAVIGTLK